MQGEVLWKTKDFFVYYFSLINIAREWLCSKITAKMLIYRDFF